MPTPFPCPDPGQYQQLAAGQLAVPESETLLDHLEGCARCAEQVEAVANQDTLVELIHQAQTQRERGECGVVARLVDQLRALRPTGPQAPPATPPAASNPDGTISDPGLSSTASSKNLDLCAFLTPAQASDELGRLGPYRILKVLGSGGMGVVFQAEDTQLQRIVALKALLPGLAASESARQRFLREARAAAALKHDHIVTIHQVGEDRGVPYLAMEFLEGEALDERLRRVGRLPLPEVLRIGKEIAVGLAAAHERGLIHRDIKPANVWLESSQATAGRQSGEDRVKILDFGLARVVTGETQLTQSGVIVGTPAYMAPEQAQGQTVDPRSDLFSLGCVLYRLATGAAPFRGTDMISTLVAVSTQEPASPRALNTELPAELSDFILQLLAKNPEERPASAQAVAGTLARMASEQPLPQVERGTAPEPVTAPPPTTGRWGLVAITALALVLVLPLGVWLSAIIVQLRGPDGVLIVEVNEPHPEVYLDGQKAIVTWANGGKKTEISLRRGTRKVEVKKDGFTVSGGEVELRDGERRTLTARFEPVAITPRTGATPAQSAPVLPPASCPTAAALAALRRAGIPPEALAAAGHGDPKKAPASLVAVLGEVQPLQTQAICLAFSPDGRWLASGSADHSLFLRAADSGQVRRALRGHTGAVSSVAFSSDSKSLISASAAGTLALWLVDREAAPQIIHPKLGKIVAMAASADGRFLAAAGAAGSVQLWKWGQWEAPRVLANQGKVTALAFSPDGELLSAGVDDETPERSIILIRTSAGKVTHSWPAHKGLIRSLSFSKDGRLLAATGGNMVKVWEVASRTTIFEHAFWRDCYGVAFHPDGKKVLAGLGGRGVLFDLATKKSLREILDDRGDIVAMAFRADGQRLALGTTTGVVEVRDVETWEPRLAATHPSHSITALAFGPGGTILSGDDDYTLRCWDLSQPGKNQLVQQFDRSIHDIVFSPDGKKFAISASFTHFDIAQRGLIWDVASGKQLAAVQSHPRVLNLAFSPDGKLLAGSDYLTRGVRCWDVASGKEVQRFPPIGRGTDPPVFSADGKLLAVGTIDTNLIKIYDVISGAELHSWKDRAVHAVALRGDCRLLATGHADGVIQLWDLTHQPPTKLTLGSHLGRVLRLQFTPADQTLISSGTDGAIRVWDLRAKRAREVLTLGSGNRPLLFDLEPSGHYLCAAGQGPLIFVFRLPQP